MQINTEIEQVISEVKESVNSISLWKEYDNDTYNSYQRVEMMRSKAFMLQQNLERLMSVILAQGGFND